MLLAERAKAKPAISKVGDLIDLDLGGLASPTGDEEGFGSILGYDCPG